MGELLRLSPGEGVRRVRPPNTTLASVAGELMGGVMRFPIHYDFDDIRLAGIRREARLGKFLNRHPRLLRLLSRFANWRNLAATYAVNERYRTLANAMPRREEDLGYTGDEEILAFLLYRRELREGRTHQASESGALYDKQLELVPTLLKSDPEIKRFLDFGVCYAHIDVELAKRFPGIEFHGIDRSPLTKILNESEFGQRPNVKFIVGDVMAHLEDTDYERSVFFHSRTALVLSRPVLEELYKRVFRAGFRYIVGFEQFGLSRETLTPFVFDVDFKESVPFRAFMFIHNYPAILKNAGFTIEQAEVFRTDHGDKDYRFLFFLARRMEAVSAE